MSLSNSSDEAVVVSGCPFPAAVTAKSAANEVGRNPHPHGSVADVQGGPPYLKLAFTGNDGVAEPTMLHEHMSVKRRSIEGLSPRALSLHFDPLSFASWDNPYDMYKRLRDEAPCYYQPERDVYFVSRYADVRAGLGDSDRLINGLGNDIDGSHDSFGKGNLVAQDPPRHTALRGSIRPTFSVREVPAHESFIRGHAERLMEQMWKSGKGDFATDYAVPLTFAISLHLVGIPLEHQAELEEHFWRSMKRVVGIIGVPDSAAAANRETEELLFELFREHAATLPAQSTSADSRVMTQIVKAVKKGTVFEDEQYGLAHLVYGAALDAPTGLLTNIVYMLDKFPDFQAFLPKNTEMVEGFVEETLRYEAPAQNLSRQSTAEITIEDTVIPADSRVMFLMGSANRDERVYENPDVFDIAREFTPDNRIMSFGNGMHACMGAPYARMAARITAEVLTAGPRIRVVGFPQRWAKQMVRGFASLPVVFDR